MFERTENYFPGTFFGFGPGPVGGVAVSAYDTEPDADDIQMSEEAPAPPVSAEPESVSIENISAEAVPVPPLAASSETSPIKKKRRRRRYSKKKVSASVSETDSTSGASPENSASE